jgi:hypothetical protein
VTTKIRENYWVIIPLFKIVMGCPGDTLAVWLPPGASLTTSPYFRVVWPLGVVGLTTSLCIAHGLIATEVGQTANSSNDRKFDLKVVIITIMVKPWVVLWSDCELYCGLTMKCIESSEQLVFRVWVINTHPAHARYLSWSFELHTLLLRVLFFLTQALLDPLWVCEILVLDLSVLELCGTSDSSSKHHWLVTLGGCRLLDGLEWKPWDHREDCEGGPVFLWEVLYSPRRSDEEQL